MKIKVKLSLLVVGILIALVAGLAAVVLIRASDLQLRATKKNQRLFAEYQARRIQGRYENYQKTAGTLAAIFSEYEAAPPEERRERFAFQMQSVLAHEPHIIAIFSIWKPNAIDGMDAQFAGQTGSTASGQFAPWVHKWNSGVPEYTTFNDVETGTANISNDYILGQPYPMKVRGKDTFAVRLTAPVINPRTKEAVALVGVNIDLAELQDIVEETIAAENDIAYMAVYSDSGFTMASFAPERTGKNIRTGDAGLFSGDNMEKAVQAIKNGVRLDMREFAPSLNTELEIVFTPITIGKAKTPWAIVTGTPRSVILAEVNTLTLFVIISAGIAAALVALVICAAVSSITNPIGKVSRTLKDISEGEGDLTKTVDIHSKDEVGDLARYFNATLEKIKSLVITIKDKTENLARVGNELAGNMNETAAAINEITASMQNVKGRAISQSASVTETMAAMRQINQHIDQLNSHTEIQADGAASFSSAIEEMMASMNSVTGTLAKNTASVQELLAASEVGRGGLQEVSRDIQEIARESEGLLEINAVMENISSQTNLLSMNAAIEAAHAGEAGKGFAVVADEIRKLAESSSEQSKTISAVLKKIKTSIDKITGSTEAVLNEFEAIDGGVRTVSGQTGNIRGAMEEQSAGSKHILEAIGQLNEVTRKVKDGSRVMLAGSKEAIAEGKNLEIAAEEISSGINEMAAGANQINAAVSRINEISGQNKENIELLVREVSRFKVA